MASPILLVAVGGSILLLAARRRPKKATDATTRNRPRRSDLSPESASHVAGAAEPDDGDERRHRIERLLAAFVADDPTPNHFYQVQEGDTLPDVAAAALRTIVARPTREQIRQYIFCISSGPRWNVRTYATPSTSKSFGSDLLVPGKGFGLRVAFLPRNDDALDAMLEDGRLPQMTTDPRTGAPSGDFGQFGLLWLPPVDPEALGAGEVTCAPYSWSDGSSTIDPPPELLALLRSP